MTDLTVVIMCGGNGTRLWPISRKLLPKQFLKLTGDLTMFQLSCKNAMNLEPKKLIIVCNGKHYHIIEKQIKELGIDNYLIISEPQGRDTCAAITSASLLAEDGNILVITADHIWDNNIFKDTVKDGLNKIKERKTIAFIGIKPTYPETGYGYIKSKKDKKFIKVVEFKEKPDSSLAKKYVRKGVYYWNSGVFLFQKDIMLEELRKSKPDIVLNVLKSIKSGDTTEKIVKLDNKLFSDVESISIDYAVMEKQTNGILLPYTGYWCDIGSFEAIFNHMKKDDNNCVLTDDTISIDSKNCLVMTENQKVGLVGCNNLAVISTRDALLVCDKGQSQKIKQLVGVLKKNKSHLTEYHTKVFRPWGWYVNVEGDDYGGFKVKRIGVYPGKRLSLQSHDKRSEHWVIVKGKAKVQVGKDFLILHPNQHVYIPKETLHRMENIGTDLVEFVETQIGEYLGEDDIKRYEDDFGRV